MEIAILVTLIAAVVLLCALLTRSYSTSKSSSHDKDTALEELRKIKEDLRIREEAFKTAEEESRRRYEDQIRELRERQQREAEAMKERHETDVKTLREQTEAQFKSLASDVLAQNTENLRKTNDTQLASLLTPLKENIERFSRAVTDSYVKENASRQSLADQVERLMKLNLTIGEEARNLTTALTRNPKTQGNWGEIVLETLLEQAGLEKGVNFEVQLTRDDSGSVIRDSAGNAQRPDVVIFLPGDRKIIIDSKVSLTSYTESCSAPTESERNSAIKRHIISVKNHIDELGIKRYQESIDGALDHVLMFMPNEGAYLSAIQHDDSLWKYAYDRRVVIVSPTHLFSVMQIVTQLWRQEKQNRNAMEIARQAGLMYDKFVGFSKDFLRFDAKIKDLHKLYADSYKRLTEGSGNLVKRAENLRKLGAKVSKKLDTTLLNDADLELPEDIQEANGRTAEIE